MKRKFLLHESYLLYIRKEDIDIYGMHIETLFKANNEFRDYTVPYKLPFS